MTQLPNFEVIIADWYRYPLALVVSAVITYLLTPFVIRFAPALGMIDLPDARRVHKTPTPRGGGLAVWAGFHGALAILFGFGIARGDQLTIQWWLAFFAASTILLIVGLFDDIRGTRPLFKLAGQAAAALALVTWGGGTIQNILGFPLPASLDLALTLFWYLALINAFNLIDGLDGLCSGMAIIGAFGLGASYVILRDSGDFMVCLALIGACLAFLRYNFNPARIFLGDTGSMFLGFALAAFALETTNKRTFAVSIGVVLLATGVPIFDTLLAIWRRSVRKFLVAGSAEVMGADKDHLHHRLLASGLTIRGTALTLYGGSAALVALGLSSIIFTQQALGIYLIGFVFFSYVIVRHIAHIELWDTGMFVTKGLSRPRPRHLSVVGYALWDLVGLILAFGFAVQILPDPVIERQLGGREEFIRSVPFWIVPMFGSIVLAQTYSRVWSKAGAMDFLILQAAIAAGGALSLSTAILSGSTNEFLLPRALIFTGASFVLITAVRSGTQVFRGLLQLIVERGQRKKVPTSRLLLYGASERSLLLMREIENHHIADADTLKVEGFLDDDINIRKRLIKGKRIFGGLADLPEIVKNVPFDEIVVCCNLIPERRDALIAFVRDRNLTLTEWETRRVPLLSSDENDS